MFKKVNIKSEPPPLVKGLLEGEPPEFQEKAKKFWEEGEYYDIYNKIIEGELITLTINRITQEDYQKFIKEGSFGNYLKDRKHCDYICQYPHKDWRNALGEYETFNTIYKNDAEDVFTKTEYRKEYDRIYFPKSKKMVKYRSLEPGHIYSNKDFFFHSLMYTFIKHEINA